MIIYTYEWYLGSVVFSCFFSTVSFDHIIHIQTGSHKHTYFVLRSKYTKYKFFTLNVQIQVLIFRLSNAKRTVIIKHLSKSPQHSYIIYIYSMLYINLKRCKNIILYIYDVFDCIFAVPVCFIFKKNISLFSPYYGNIYVVIYLLLLFLYYDHKIVAMYW